MNALMFNSDAVTLRWCFYSHRAPKEGALYEHAQKIPVIPD